MNWLEKVRITIATAVVTAAATSAYWVIAYDLFGLNGQSDKGNIPAAVAAPQPLPSNPTNTGVDPGADIAALAPAKRVKLNSVTPVRIGALAIPVVGVKAQDLRDTFNDAREEGERVHDAIDIMSPLGTPVIAAAPGTVEKIWESEKGGHTVYVRSPDRRIVYYYAHLDAYAASLREKMTLKAGDPIGTVGYSGNASPDGPHLHFAVMQTEPDASWSEGTAVNPYPLLTARQ